MRSVERSDGRLDAAAVPGDCSGGTDRAAHPIPELIVMDLKMPRKTGLEILEWLKKDSFLKRIPVVILTSAQKEVDLMNVSKPGNLHDFVSAVESISAFWFGCAYLMRKEDK